MAITPINVKLDFTNLHCTEEADGAGSAEPYMWTVFFKIDGDTVRVGPDLKLHGKATVVTTPGNHGDLLNNDVDAGENVPIPKALGHFQTTLKPIPVDGLSLTVGGAVGAVVVLMEEDSTPASAIAKGHTALNKALTDELNKLIPTLGLTKQSPTNEDLKNMENQIGSAVMGAIKKGVGVWSYIGGIFGNGQDDKIGTAEFIFPHSKLAENQNKSIPLKKRWDENQSDGNGDWTLTGKVAVSHA